MWGPGGATEKRSVFQQIQRGTGLIVTPDPKAAPEPGQSQSRGLRDHRPIFLLSRRQNQETKKDVTCLELVTG